MVEIFIYGDTEINYLKKRDKKLASAIETIGPIKREVNPNLFSALVNAIVGQQISRKSKATVCQRMLENLGEINPQTIFSRSESELQSLGISFRKAAYIRGAAERVLDGRLDLETLRLKSDEEVCKVLSAIEGIGIWTAEMLLLFSMQRPDIFSFGDFGILRGLRMLYSHNKITKELFEKYRKRYSPYGSTASLYLWAIAGDAIPEMKEPASFKKI